MLIRFVEFEIPARLLRRPAEDEREVIDEGSLGQLLQRFLVILNIHHREQHAEMIFARQRSDPGIDIFRVKPVVLQTEEKRARGGAQNVIGGDVAIFPREGPD